jgi:hypothetical protein
LLRGFFSRLGNAVESRLEAMNIGITPLDAAAITGLSHAGACRFIIAIKFNLIQKFIFRAKKNSFFAFLEKFAMFVSAVCQQHAPAGWNFECAGRVLVWANNAKKSQSDLGSGERPRIVIAIDFVALQRKSQKFVTMDLNFSLRVAGKLTQDKMPPKTPFSVA